MQCWLCAECGALTELENIPPAVQTLLLRWKFPGAGWPWATYIVEVLLAGCSHPEALLRLLGSAWLIPKTVLPLLTEVCWEGIVVASIAAAAAAGHHRIDLGGRKQNLHFNVHMLSSFSNSPSREIIVLLARIICVWQVCLPWLRARGAPVCVWMLLLQGGSTARTNRESGEKLSQTKSLECLFPEYMLFSSVILWGFFCRIFWSCYRLVIDHVTPTALWEQGCMNALKENALAFPVSVLAL